MSDGTTISYDTIGNPLTWRGGLSFTWQNGRQLSTAQKSGLSLSYRYNASGIRTEKTVNGVTTEYYLDGSSIVAEKTGTDVIWYLYDGMGLAGFELNGTSYYYVYNGQGDVIGILDSSGNRVVTYTYDSWGSPLSVTGSLASTVGQKNPIRYRGYYYDTETGLYYLQSRYYDPVVGRFLNGDNQLSGIGGLPLGYNIFVYCANNPVCHVDLTGTDWVLNGVTYVYDGSIADFHRLEAGLSPLAYELAVAEERAKYAAIVYTETGGLAEPYKEAVAHVINNRVGTSTVNGKSTRESITDVISEPAQFSGYKNDMYNEAMGYFLRGEKVNAYNKAAMKSCMSVVIKIYDEKAADTTNGALFFYSPRSMNPPGRQPAWARERTEVTIEGIDPWYFKFYK